MNELHGSVQLRFHHVGLACASLKRERESMLRLGFVDEGPQFEDPIQRIRGIFMLNGGYRLELLEPLEPGSPSPLDSYLDRGTKLYHQAFTTRDLRHSIGELVATGAVVTLDPVPSVAFGGREIAFIMLRGMNLVELIEEAA